VNFEKTKYKIIIILKKGGKMNKPYTLYEHIFPDGKRYIGITCQAINARWKNGHGYETQSKVYEAIQKYGALKGGFLAVRRLLRCHPFSKADPFDPVP
jgi:hypothetical protein